MKLTSSSLTNKIFLCYLDKTDCSASAMLHRGARSAIMPQWENIQMTKKDYIAIAAAIKQNRGVSQDVCNVLDELAKDLCEIFERDNSRFDIVRFMHACR